MRKRQHIPTLPSKPRLLTESFILEASSPTQKLKVDEDAGIIYGVKLLGSSSPNCHGLQGVTEGTEYTQACKQSACKLYEGATSYFNHDRKAGDGARDGNDTFGVIRNVRLDENGEPRGDLHYYKTHPVAPRVVEDVLRGLGRFGMSHNAYPKKAFVRDGKYIVESLETVRSVDVVDKPATTKNLAESQESTTVKTTAKAILTEAIKKLSPVRQKIGKRLLEDDSMPMDTPMDAPAEPDADEGSGDPMKDGIRAVINAVLDDDSLDAMAKLAKIKLLLKTHEQLTADTEPTDDSASTDASSTPPADDSKTMESLQAKLKSLEAKDACRTLCESLSVVPSPTLLKALCLLESTEERKALIAESKPSKTVPAAPKSSGPPRKNVTESGELATPKDAKEFARLIAG